MSHHRHARVRRLALLAVALATLVACATGNADWRRESYRTTVELRDAGDGRCSDPAPFTSLRACLIHDAAYETARRIRCEDREDLDALASEQSRLAADYQLAAQMALDGYPEWWVEVYRVAVRVGGVWSWHWSGCPP